MGRNFNSFKASLQRVRRHVTILLTLGASILVIAGHGGRQRGVSERESAAIEGGGTPAHRERLSPGPQARKGLRVQTRWNKDFRCGSGAHCEGSEQLIRSMATELNTEINFPEDVDISFETCRHLDVFYSPPLRRITICYDVIDDMTDLLLPHIRNRSKLCEAVDSIIASMFLHEVSHALIDLLKLPTTGREEDAADQFSTLMLMNRFDREKSIMTIARVYRILAEIERHEELVYWDEHSQDFQRYYDTLCLIYGRNPQKYSYLVSKGTLPKERAELCEEDFNHIKNAWKSLLKPYANDSLWVHK